MPDDMISTLNNLMTLQKNVQNPPMASYNEEAAKKAIENLQEDQNMLAQSRDMEKYIQSNPETAKKIMGPLAGRVSGNETLTDFMAARDPQWNAAKDMRIKLLNIINPYHKTMFGSRISQEMQEESVKPVFPALTQTPDNFLRTNRSNQFYMMKMLERNDNLLRQMGVNTDQYIQPETKQFYQTVQGMPEDKMREYFNQAPDLKSNPMQIQGQGQ